MLSSEETACTKAPNYGKGLPLGLTRDVLQGSFLWQEKAKAEVEAKDDSTKAAAQL